MDNWQFIPITRAGSAVAGSPFRARVRYRRLHVDPQIAPIAARRPVQEFLIFENIHAAVQVGDLAMLPDGTMTKIIDVRSYEASLQCMLQRLPYVSLPAWLPVGPAAALLPDRSLPDVTYCPTASVWGSIEPHGLDRQGPLPIGRSDRRSGWIFTLTPTVVNTVVLNYPDYWLVIESSGIWPISSDYRAACRRLAKAPLGVT